MKTPKTIYTTVYQNVPLIKAMKEKGHWIGYKNQIWSLGTEDYFHSAIADCLASRKNLSYHETPVSIIKGFMLSSGKICFNEVVGTLKSDGIDKVKNLKKLFI